MLLHYNLVNPVRSARLIMDEKLDYTIPIGNIIYLIIDNIKCHITVTLSVSLFYLICTFLVHNP